MKDFLIALCMTILGVLIIAGAITLQVAWLGFCFGTVVVGIVILIFAPHVLFLPISLLIPGFTFAYAGIKTIEDIIGGEGYFSNKIDSWRLKTSRSMNITKNYASMLAIIPTATARPIQDDTNDNPKQPEAIATTTKKSSHKPKNSLTKSERWTLIGGLYFLGVFIHRIGINQGTPINQFTMADSAGAMIVGLVFMYLGSIAGRPKGASAERIGTVSGLIIFMILIINGSQR